jgi:hypothetical protein
MITLNSINPIDLVAVVSSSGGGYTVTVDYGTTTADAIEDTFGTIPDVTVNVTSTTVPSGYYLRATGDGSWTANSASSLTGTFTGGTGLSYPYSFTVHVTNGTTVLASHDPRLTLKKLGSG